VICCLDGEIQPRKVRFLRFVAWFLVLRSELSSFFCISEAVLLVFHVRHVTRGEFLIPDGETHYGQASEIEAKNVGT
jgi:hypothetical protein